LNRKLKLIWDFRGPDALQTAKHHAVHLKEFALSQKLHFYEVGIIELSDGYIIAFIVVDETDMPVYRDALKPHRGVVVA